MTGLLTRGFSNSSSTQNDECVTHSILINISLWLVPIEKKLLHPRFFLRSRVKKQLLTKTCGKESMCTVCVRKHMKFFCVAPVFEPMWESYRYDTSAHSC